MEWEKKAEKQRKKNVFEDEKSTRNKMKYRADMSVSRSSAIPAPRCPGTTLFRYCIVPVPHYPGTTLSRYNAFSVLCCPGIVLRRVPRYPGRTLFRYRVVLVFAIPVQCYSVIALSWYRAIAVPRNSGIAFSQYRTLPVPRYPATTQFRLCALPVTHSPGTCATSTYLLRRTSYLYTLYFDILYTSTYLRYFDTTLNNDAAARAIHSAISIPRSRLNATRFR